MEDLTLQPLKQPYAKQAFLKIIINHASKDALVAVKIITIQVLATNPNLHPKEAVDVQMVHNQLLFRQLTATKSRNSNAKVFSR